MFTDTFAFLIGNYKEGFLSSFRRELANSSKAGSDKVDWVCRRVRTNGRQGEKETGFGRI